jgi:hypothetical protein
VRIGNGFMSIRPMYHNQKGNWVKRNVKLQICNIKENKCRYVLPRKIIFRQCRSDYAVYSKAVYCHINRHKHAYANYRSAVASAVTGMYMQANQSMLKLTSIFPIWRIIQSHIPATVKLYTSDKESTWNH